MNMVGLVGRLTRDPELKYTQEGTAVTNFTIAVNRPFANKKGEREADFFNVIVWRKPAENVANFTRKGSQVSVSGRLQSRSYEKDGNRVYVTEVVADSVQFLDPKNSNPNAGGGNNPPAQNQQQQQQQQQQTQGQNQNQSQNQNQNYTNTDHDPFSTGGGPIEVSDDDLPF